MIRKRFLAAALLFTLAVGCAGTMTVSAAAAAPAVYAQTDKLTLADQDLAAKDYAGALKNYQSVMTGTPSEMKAYLGALKACAGLKDTASAQTIFAKALSKIGKFSTSERKSRKTAIIAILKLAADIYKDQPTKAYSALLKGLKWYPGNQAVTKARDQLLSSTMKVWKKTFCDENGKVNKYYIFHYNTAGFETSCTGYDADGSVTGKVKFTLNADGTMKSAKETDAKGTLLYTYAFTYNADGDMTSETDYKADQTKEESWTWEYDANRNCTKSSCIDSDGTETAVVYEYNADGLEVKETDYKNGAATESTAYTYNAKGVAVKELHYDAAGTLTESITYALNAKGKPVVYLGLAPDGSPMSSGMSVYNTDGKRTGGTRYYANGNVEETGTISYDAFGGITRVTDCTWKEDGTLKQNLIYDYQSYLKK